MEATGGTTAQRERRSEATGSCLLCGRSGGPARLAEGGYVGRECDCGIIYIDPVPEPAAVAPTADAHLESYYSLPARLRLDWISQFVSGGRFLDVGCGTGQLVGQALARGFEVAAVEPNAACAALVRDRYGIDVETALIEDSTLPSSSYDLVYHVDLLSHFPDPVRALESMADRLTPTGVMGFEVGLFAGLAPGWYPWVGRPRFPAHRWFFSPIGLARLLERAGLELVAIHAFAIGPSTVISSALRRVLPDGIEAVPVPDPGDGLPGAGRPVQRAYARMHHILRYRVGAVVAIPGPKTAFVAARRVDSPEP